MDTRKRGRAIMDETQGTTLVQPGAQHTQPQAEIAARPEIDMQQIDRVAQARAERAAKTVMTDMLKQQGIDDPEAIKQIIAEWKSKQKTPDQELMELKDALAAEKAKLAEITEISTIKEHGISDPEEIALYRIRINQLAKEGDAFADVANEYFKKNAHIIEKPKVTVSFGGTGKTPMTQSETDSMIDAWNNAIKGKDTAMMSMLTRRADEKGIKLSRG